MRVDEIMSSPLMEMAYNKRKAESIITGLEDPINTHLLKLAVVVGEGRAEVHWRHELVTWLTKIARIRLKPSDRPGPAAFYYRILYDEPYGGSETRNVAMQVRLLARDYTIAPTSDSSSIAARLKVFHLNFAKACASGDLDDTGIEAMVSCFGGVQQTPE